ncbi:MAG: hypothetical protein D6763_07960, partial [Alphaproteobacteria bacterium]
MIRQKMPQTASLTVGPIRRHLSFFLFIRWLFDSRDLARVLLVSGQPEFVRQTMHPIWNNLGLVLSGGAQTVSTDNALTGLPGATANTASGPSFGSELATLLGADPGAVSGRRAGILTTASSVALTFVPANLPTELSAAARKGTARLQGDSGDLPGVTGHGSGAINPLVMDPGLTQTIREQILEAAHTGEIKLPKAWTKALASGEQIRPQIGETPVEPAIVRDILAVLGFIPVGPQEAGSVAPVVATPTVTDKAGPLTEVDG